MSLYGEGARAGVGEMTSDLSVTNLILGNGDMGTSVSRMIDTHG